MRGKLTLSPGCLIFTAILVSFLSTVAVGQRPKAPKALLDAIDPDDRSCVTQEGLDKSVTVQPVRLANDGSRQLLIRGAGLCLCGAQNCGFWIYRKRGDGYQLLLKGAGSVTVKAARQMNKGYRDITSESHASAIETIVRTYRFDGQQYQLQRCVVRAYYDEQGGRIKTPRYHPCEEQPKS